jgi:hypothetical protein
MSNITGIIEKGGSLVLTGVDKVTEKVTIEGNAVLIEHDIASWIMVIILIYVLWRIIRR